MKKIVMMGAVAVILGIGGYVAYGVLTSSSLSPRQTVSDSYRGVDISLTYCRPSKKGRLIFGEAGAGALVPYGKYWRMGANEATEITFSKDVMFGGKPLKAGSYRMYAVPSGSTWVVALNSELGKWGYDEPNHDLDVLEVSVPVGFSETITEQFTVTFSDGATRLYMNIDWDKAHLSVPIQVSN